MLPTRKSFRMLPLLQICQQMQLLLLDFKTIYSLYTQVASYDISFYFDIICKVLINMLSFVAFNSIGLLNFFDILPINILAFVLYDTSRISGLVMLITLSDGDVNHSWPWVFLVNVTPQWYITYRCDICLGSGFLHKWSDRLGLLACFDVSSRSYQWVTVERKKLQLNHELSCLWHPLECDHILDILTKFWTFSGIIVRVHKLHICTGSFFITSLGKVGINTRSRRPGACFYSVSSERHMQSLINKIAGVSRWQRWGLESATSRLPSKNWTLYDILSTQPLPHLAITLNGWSWPLKLPLK